MLPMSAAPIMIIFIETLAGFSPTIQAANSTSLGKINSIVQFN